MILAAALPLLLLSACGAAPEPADSPDSRIAGTSVQPAPPVRSLIGFRDRLSLTSEQVVALDSIATWLEEVNSSYRRVVIGRTGERGETPVGPELLAAVDSISANRREADRAVAELLSEEQRTAVCELARRAGGAGARPQGAGRREGGRTGAGDGATRAGWSWCAAAGGGGDTAE